MWCMRHLPGFVARHLNNAKISFSVSVRFENVLKCTAKVNFSRYEFLCTLWKMLGYRFPGSAEQTLEGCCASNQMSVKIWRKFNYAIQNWAMLQCLLVKLHGGVGLTRYAWFFFFDWGMSLQLWSFILNNIRGLGLAFLKSSVLIICSILFLAHPLFWAMTGNAFSKLFGWVYSEHAQSRAHQ